MRPCDIYMHRVRVRAGEGIMGDLATHRETLVRVRGNVGVVSGSLDEARRILRSE